MKKYILIVMMVLGVSLSAEAQSKTSKVTFEVDGVCKMCKDRIEKTVLKTKGVKFASWDATTGDLYCIYSNKKTSELDIKKALAEAGHDTKEVKATQQAYDALPDCCRYRDGEVKKH